MAFQLRDYQETGIEQIKDSIRGGSRRICYQLPTGGGKTRIFSHIVSGAAAKGNSALILVHRTELLRQSSVSLTELGVPHGIISPNNIMTLDPIQIASVQTLVRRLDHPFLKRTPGILVIDEAHHAVAGSWLKVISHFSSSVILGVTATPRRLDGRGLGEVFDSLILGPPMSELKSRGFLTGYDIYTHPDVAEIGGKFRMSMGDFDKAQISEAVDKPKIIGNAVAHYSKICPGAPFIAFCANVAHAENTALAFRNAGYNVVSLDGGMDKDVRKRAIESLANGSLHGITSCDIISEGTDIPRATVAILLRPTASETLFLQQVGRVLRPVYSGDYDLSGDDGRLAAISASEKPRAIILDHVGNVGEFKKDQFIPRHGLPDADRDWSLDAKKRKKSSAKATSVPIRVCENCYLTYPPRLNVCPGCGHVHIISQPKHGEGELRQIVIVDNSAQKREELKKARTREQLEEFAKKHGYKSGFVNHEIERREKYKQKILDEWKKKEIMGGRWRGPLRGIFDVIGKQREGATLWFTKQEGSLVGMF